MPRTARIIKPDFPHHIVQRGNRKMPVFFKENDYRFYLELLKECCDKHDIDVWAYCLMPNHVHLVVVPRDTSSLSQALGQTHRRYTQMVNKREGWSGYLWQGRFASYVMDEAYALSAVRYVERNPVEANIVRHPEEYQWSSAKAHVEDRPDPLLKDNDLRALVTDWRQYLSQNEHESVLKDLSKR